MSILPSDETIDGATNNIERAIARATTSRMFFMGNDMFAGMLHKAPSTKSILHGVLLQMHVCTSYVQRRYLFSDGF